MASGNEIVFKCSTDSVEHEIMEGDIVYIRDVDLDDLFQDNVTTRLGARWANSEIPFKVDLGIHEYIKDAFQEAMKLWSLVTPVKFVQVRSSHDHFVRFTSNNAGSKSNVGKYAMFCEGGANFQETILVWNVDKKIATGVALHEIGHLLGLYHTHSRKDRDIFVNVRIEDIKKPNFKIHLASIDVLGYEYQSIMHYPWCDSVYPKGGQEVYQRAYLSNGDVAAIRKVYGSKDTLYPQVAALIHNDQLHVFGQTVANDVVKVTILNSGTAGASPLVENIVTMQLKCGLSASVARDGSVELFALQEPNVIVKIFQEGSVWTTATYRLHESMVLVGGVLPADHMGGERKMFAYCADGSIVVVCGKKSRVIYSPNISGSTKHNSILNGAPLVGVTDPLDSSLYHVFGVTVLGNVFHLTADMAVCSSAAIEPPLVRIHEKPAGFPEIAKHRVFASSKVAGSIDLFAFGSDGSMLRIVCHGNTADWRRCVCPNAIIPAPYFAIASVSAQQYRFFTTGRGDEVQMFQYNTDTDTFTQDYPHTYAYVAG